MKFLKYLALGILLLFLITACKSKEEVDDNEKTIDFGKVVVFDYASGFDNGTLLDTSFETVAREAGIFDPNRVYGPEVAVIGKDPLIPGLLEALLGMKEGEIKNIRIPPEKAYGVKLKNSEIIMSKESFDNPENLNLGQLLVIENPEGEKISVFVSKLDKENITVDLNHPLAGEYIQFSIIVRSVK